MVIYLDGQSGFRADMRDPYSPARVHAICRRLTGCSQDSKWYGAHYRAACALLVNPATASDPRRDGLATRLERWAGSFACEVSGEFDFEGLGAGYRALWRLAVNRVSLLLREAEALPTSVMW
jgi:hypothetical protein